MWKRDWGDLIIKEANGQMGRGRRGREIVPKTEQEKSIGIVG